MARCVGVYYLKTEHRHNGCFSLHNTQGLKELEGVDFDLKDLEGAGVDAAAKDLLLVLDLSSCLGFANEELLMRSCASALFFNQSLKSSNECRTDEVLINRVHRPLFAQIWGEFT